MKRQRKLVREEKKRATLRKERRTEGKKGRTGEEKGEEESRGDRRGLRSPGGKNKTEERRKVAEIMGNEIWGKLRHRRGGR